MLRFTIPGKPEPKARPRRGKGGQFYTPRSTSSYEARVRSIARAIIPPGSGWPTLDHVEVVFDIYFETDEGDIDNVEKAIMDGLAGPIYANDKQVKSKAARARVDRQNPRAELLISIDPGPLNGAPYVYDSAEGEWVIRSPDTGTMWEIKSMKRGVRLRQRGQTDHWFFESTIQAMKAIHDHEA